jgi:predicted dehydrogenase
MTLKQKVSGQSQAMLRTTKKVGIIGFGEMGKRSAKEFDEATGGLIEVAAVFDPNKSQYEEGCRWTNRRPRYYDSITGLIEHEKLDGIYIASPNFLHLANIRELEQALPRSQNPQATILLEKPLDTELSRICEMVRFAQRYSGEIIVEHPMRYAPIVTKAKELIAAGEIGQVTSANLAEYLGMNGVTPYRRTVEHLGTMMLAKGTHDLDVLLYILQSLPVRVAGSSKPSKVVRDKPDDLHCSSCPDSLNCQYSIGRSQQRVENLRDIDFHTDWCVLSQKINIPDDEVCLIEFANDTFATFGSYCGSWGLGREYTLNGTEGRMRILFNGQRYREMESDGCIIVYKSGGYEMDSSQKYDFYYHGRIHYDGGPYMARHFYDVMCGESKPFTTVSQAFAAELISLAALESDKDKSYKSVATLIPDDLKDLFFSTSWASIPNTLIYRK